MLLPENSTILIVDRDEFSSGRLVRWAREIGYRVVKAVNGEEGFMRFRKEAPQVALVSVQLDKVLGNVLCQRIKSQPAGANTRIILMSDTYTKEELGRRAVKMFKADDFLSRPVTRNAFFDAVPRLEKPKPVEAPAKKEKEEIKAPPPAKPGAPKPPKKKAPIVKGSLGDQPLPKLLISMHSLKRTGTLLLERNQIQRHIFFSSGMIGYATSSFRNEAPLHFFVKKGLISEDEAAGALDAIAAGNEQWDYLVGNTSLTFEALQEGLSDLAQEIVTSAFDWHEGHFEFTPDENVMEDIPNLDICPIYSILTGAARAYPLKKIIDEIAPYKNKFLYRTDLFEGHIERLKLTTKELKFTLLIDGKTKYNELITFGKSDITRSVQILWALLKSGMIKESETVTKLKHAEFFDAGAASRAGEPQKALDEKKRAEAMREYFRIKSSNYFEVFRVERAAASDDVEEAFGRLESRFHPDLFEGMDIDDLRPKLEEIMDKARTARRVLIDPKRKADYITYLSSRQVTTRVTPPVEAEISYREAEKSLLAGDFKDAEAKFRKAISLNPSEPDYYSYLGWTLFCAAGDDKKKVLKKAKDFVNRAISMNPNSDKAYLIMGRMLKEEGKLDLSLDHFEAALKMNSACKPAMDGIKLVRALQSRAKAKKKK